MHIFKRRGRAVFAVLASAAATAFFVLPASPAGAVTFTNACKNSVSPNNSQLDVDLTGSSPAQVQPNESFTLSSISQTVGVPSAVFVAGYNLGIIDDGDSVTGSLVTRIEGTNSVEGIQQTPAVPITVGPIDISDPDATPGSGDETAAPLSTTANFPDQAWTAGPTGALIEFREDTVDPVSPGNGGIIINVSAVVTDIQFRCSPGTVAGENPGVITFIDPGPSFAATEVLGPPETTITKGPDDKTKKKRATFEFTSSKPGSSFECSLDGKAFAPCTSPDTVKAKKGKHTFEVRAKDQAGETDPTPASDSWKVKKKKKKK